MADKRRTSSSRTRVRNPEASQAAILDAATECFLERGFNGTSMSEVAERAQVPKSLIHHYFDTKEQLWAEVKRRVHASYHQEQETVFSGNADDPMAALKDSMRIYASFLRNNRHALRMMHWSRLEEDSAVDPSTRKMVERGFATIAQAQADGLIRSDVEPAIMLAGLIALTQYRFESTLYGSMVKRGERKEDVAGDAAYIESMWKILERGIAGPSLDKRSAADSGKKTPTKPRQRNT